MSVEPHIRAITPDDRDWIEGVLTAAWTSPWIRARGRTHNALELPGFLARSSAGRVGVVTYRIDGEECEIISLNAEPRGRGTGSALVAAVVAAARAAGCRSLCLVTSNDNLPALRFYQKRGFRLVAVHRGAIDEARKTKPKIPTLGLYDIPLRDEIELARGLWSEDSGSNGVTGM